MIWRYIKAKPFFQDFLPAVKSYSFKIIGKNSKGNPVSFSAEEKEKIRTAMYEMVDECLKSL